MACCGFVRGSDKVQKYQRDESYTTKGAGECGGLLELKGCEDKQRAK
jgi:hypothetical protein